MKSALNLIISLIIRVTLAVFSFRYYFKVQAKNVFGLGPISETLSYVTESGESGTYKFKMDLDT